MVSSCAGCSGTSPGAASNLRSEMNDHLKASELATADPQLGARMPGARVPVAGMVGAGQLARMT